MFDYCLVLLVSIAVVGNSHSADYNTTTLSSKMEKMENSRQFKLVETLFNSYHPAVRPVYNSSTKTPVRYGLLLRELVQLDEVGQSIKVVLENWLKWHDEFLVWNDTEFADIRVIDLPDDGRVWRPYIILRNLKEQERIEYSPPTYKLESDGTVETIVLWQATASCPAHTYRFPYEIVTCDLFFSNWGSSIDDLDIDIFHHGVASRYNGNSEWTLLSSEILPKHVKAKFMNLGYRFRFSRRPDFFVANLLVPNFLLIFLCGLQFLLPHDGGERVSLTITFLLAITVLLLVIADKVPPSSFNIPALSIYFGISSYMSGIAVLITILTALMHSHGGKKKVPKVIAFLFLRILARTVCVKTRFHNSGNGIRSKHNANGRRIKSEKSINAKDWKKLAKICDRLGFIIYYVVAVFLTFWFYVGVYFSDDSKKDVSA